MGEGVTAEFPVKPGRVTVMRLGNVPSAFRMLIAGGEAVETEQIVRGNPLEVRLGINVRDFLERVTSEGIEHHYLMVHGNVMDELTELCDLLGIAKVVI